MCDQLRWDYLSCYRPSAAAHPQHRCAGGPRRALHAGLRAVARVRRLAHELLHGPLRASHGATWNGVPLKVGEMTLGDYLRPLGVRDGAGRQDAHARRPGGHAAARHRSQLHHRRARHRMRLRSLRARRRPARRRSRRALRSADARATTATSTTRATPATIPGTTGPTRRRARATRWPPAGPCGTRASPRAWPRRIPRRPT